MSISTKTLRAALLLAVVFPLPILPAAAAGAQCRVEKQAELPLVGAQRLMLVGVEINGAPFTMLVDTGAPFTAVTQSIAQRLQLPADPRHGGMHHGVASFSSSVNAIVRSFKVGGIEMENRSLSIIPFTSAADVNPPVAGLLGADFLFRFDLEIDLPQRRLTLYRNPGCADGVPPWDGSPITIPLVKSATNRLNLAASVDGHPFRAIIDTGASVSLITRPNALRAGVTAETLERDPSVAAHDIGTANFSTRRHVFDEVQIGPERFKNAALHVGGTVFGGGDMLLGIDYLGRRRVWISYLLRRMFIAPATAGQSAGGAPTAR